MQKVSHQQGFFNIYIYTPNCHSPDIFSFSDLSLLNLEMVAQDNPSKSVVYEIAFKHKVLIVLKDEVEATRLWFAKFFICYILLYCL